MDKLVQAWVDGWVVSRGAAPPVAEPWGCTIDVGTGPHHVTRHVLGATRGAVGKATVRKVAGTVTGAGVWLKVFADPSPVRDWLGPDWWIDPEPGYLMSAPLTDVPPGPVPEGYRQRTSPPRTAPWPHADRSPRPVRRRSPTRSRRPPHTAVADSAPSSCAHFSARRSNRAPGRASWAEPRKGGRCTSHWAGVSSRP